MGRGSIFGHVANSPAPDHYSAKAAPQQIKIKPNLSKSMNPINMDRQSGTLEDRSKFLYKKHPEEYEQHYHQELQANKSISTLRKTPVVKIGKYADRDKVTHNKEVAAIMNE